jgi:D-galactarolactone cycloisomerase
MTNRTTWSASLKIDKVEAWALRAPIAVPVRSSFGAMANRPAVFIRIVDADGCAGWGEVWCNFPPVGAEHRARLVNELVGPALRVMPALATDGLFEQLMARFHIMILQSGEFGPFRQVCAGLDMACHDLAARRAGLPLWRFLGGTGSGRIDAYASGIAPEDVDTVGSRELAAGHRAFKLKVGFDEASDRSGLERLRAQIGSDARLMADANQAWSVEAAIDRVARLAEFDLTWLEEPLAADRPAPEWQRVAAAAPMRLAAGENMNATDEFDAAIAGGAIRYVQPDAAKWGGISGCLRVARQALAAGHVYCPHFLGGGIGLLASAHLLAAAGGPGLLEIDSNPNPWRQLLVGDHLRVKEGSVTLGDEPGIGVDPGALGLPLD